MSKKFLSLVMALVMIASVSLQSFAVSIPENFYDLSKEEKTQWIYENVIPVGEYQNAMQDRAAGWHYVTRSSEYLYGDDFDESTQDITILLGEMTSTVKWLVDANGNITQAQGVSMRFDVDEGATGLVMYVPSNNEMQVGLQVIPSRINMICCTYLYQIQSGSSLYFAQVYYCNGSTYNLQIVQDNAGINVNDWIYNKK